MNHYIPHNENELIDNLYQQHQDLFRIVHVEKKTNLLVQGEIADALYIVREGMLRLYHTTDDGKDITLQFFAPGQCVSSIESFFLNTPSNFSLETICNCTLARISREDVLRCLNTDAEHQHLAVEYACLRLIDYISLFLSRIKDSPEKRYTALLATQPELLEQVPHHYIASYLGISATSLSRIRHRLSEKDDER